jgi:large subunit ribosomal protein L19
MAAAASNNLLERISAASLRPVVDFEVGDNVKVHAKIIEGTKERVQIFEGVVIKRSQGKRANATFTVRKISYNIGVERTFYVHSPRIEKIEITTRAKVRRARLFYLRPLRGKAARMKTLFGAIQPQAIETPEAVAAEATES